jgi:preprotein translocase subunit SecE
MSENEKQERTEQVSSNKPEKTKSDKKPEKKKKPGFFSRVSKWLRELRSELKKVQWPTKKQTINNTWIVIVCVIVVGAFIWVFDFIATGAIRGLISLLG